MGMSDPNLLVCWNSKSKVSKAVDKVIRGISLRDLEKQTMTTQMVVGAQEDGKNVI